MKSSQNPQWGGAACPLSCAHQLWDVLRLEGFVDSLLWFSTEASGDSLNQGQLPSLVHKQVGVTEQVGSSH